MKKTKKIKVSFIFDPKNNWLKKYIKKITFKKYEKKYEFFFAENYKLVKKNDIVFILGYTKKIDKKFLVRNKLNLIIHESQLPKGKGFSPVQWQILDNKKKIPVCLIKASEKIDSGEIFMKSSITLTGFELYEEIRLKQAKITETLISDFLENYPNINFKKQKGKETFYKKRDLNDSKLNINKTIKEQFNLIRIANNEDWPLFFNINKHKYILKVYKK